MALQAAPRDVQFRPDQVAFEQRDCPICLSSFENHEIVTELACKHIFHKHCIEDPRNGNSCPTCRTPIAGRVQHQVNLEGGRRFLLNLFPLFSDDPAVLNQRLEERAQRAIREKPQTFHQAIAGEMAFGFGNLVRRHVLGEELSLNVRQRADALFLDQEMNMIRPLNRIRRFLRIQQLPQHWRLMEVCVDPLIRTEFSQRVSREHRADSNRAIVVCLTMIAGLLIYVEFFRRPNL